MPKTWKQNYGLNYKLHRLTHVHVAVAGGAIDITSGLVMEVSCAGQTETSHQVAPWLWEEKKKKKWSDYSTGVQWVLHLWVEERHVKIQAFIQGRASHPSFLQA